MVYGRGDQIPVKLTEYLQYGDNERENPDWGHREPRLRTGRV